MNEQTISKQKMPTAFKKFVNIYQRLEKSGKVYYVKFGFFISERAFSIVMEAQPYDKEHKDPKLTYAPEINAYIVAQAIKYMPIRSYEKIMRIPRYTSLLFGYSESVNSITPAIRSYYFPIFMAIYDFLTERSFIIDTKESTPTSIVMKREVY